MANQFNTTHHTQTTSDNTPSQSQAIDEAVQAIARNAQVPLAMARQCVMGALDYNTQTTSNAPNQSQAIDEAVQAIARNAQAPLDMARQCVMGALDYNTQTTSNAPNQSQAIDEAVQAIARNAQAPLDMSRQCVMGALDYNTQNTSDNTPTSAEFLGQAIFTGDEWQTLINALDNYESQISDLAEVMPADDQTATTAHPVTGEPVSREAIANELECFGVLNDIIHDQSLSNCHALNLTASVYNDFGHIDDDQLEAVDIGFTVNKILVNAIFYACYQVKDELNGLQSTWQGAKDKATKKAMKRFKNDLNHLASISNKLANAIYDIRLDLAQSQADTDNHIFILPPHEAVTLWHDEWLIYCDAYQQDSNTAPELDSNTLAYIQRLESENQQLKDRLKRQRINHSDSITTSICHLEYIKANLQALESVTFDNNPNFEDSQEYLLFGTLEYLIKSYMNDQTNAQNQLEQGGDHASI